MIIYIIATILAIIFAILLGVKYGMSMAENYYEHLIDGGITHSEEVTDEDADPLQKLGFTKHIIGTAGVLYVRKLPYYKFEYESIHYEHNVRSIKLDIRSNKGYIPPDLLDAIYNVRNTLWEK